MRKIMRPNLRRYTDNNKYQRVKSWKKCAMPKSGKRW